MKKYIITVLGQDRPGIIAAVSKSLFELDCNIENVKQMILQSEFAGIFIVALPEETGIESIETRLKSDLAPLGLDLHMKEMGPRANPADSKSEPFIITTVGPDKKGLVASMTAIIAAYGVNVTNLQAVFEGGDDPDKNIMIYEVDIPAGVDQAGLMAALRKKAEALNLDLSIQHRNIFKVMNRI